MLRAKGRVWKRPAAIGCRHAGGARRTSGQRQGTATPCARSTKISELLIRRPLTAVATKAPGRAPVALMAAGRTGPAIPPEAQRRRHPLGQHSHVRTAPAEAVSGVPQGLAARPDDHGYEPRAGVERARLRRRGHHIRLELRPGPAAVGSLRLVQAEHDLSPGAGGRVSAAVRPARQLVLMAAFRSAVPPGDPQGDYIAYANTKCPRRHRARSPPQPSRCARIGRS